MQELSVSIALALPVFIAFNVRVVTGFGSAILLSPLLSNFFPPKEVVVLMILMESLINVVFFVKERVTFRLVEVYSGGLAGILLGIALFAVISQRLTGIAIGVGMAVISVLMLVGVRFRVRRERILLFFSGIVSGVMGVLTGVNGPQIVLALSNQGYSAESVRSFIIAYLMVIDTVILLAFVVFGYVGESVLRNFLIFSPSVVLAYFTGRRLLGIVDDGTLRRAMLLAVLVSSVILIVRYSGV